MKLIAVQGCTLIATPSGVAKITSPAATDVMVDNKGAYFGTLSISVSGATSGSASGGEGVGTLIGTSKNCTNHGQPAVLENDECSVSVTGTSTKPPYNPETWTVTVKISVAGQTSMSSD